MIALRKVRGNSMKPSFRDGQVVLMTTNRSFKIDDVVIAYVQGREVLKRVKGIRVGSIYLTGDNEPESTDSRQYGWIKDTSVIGVVLWPRR